jgi:hypothetical protein
MKKLLSLFAVIPFNLFFVGCSGVYSQEKEIGRKLQEEKNILSRERLDRVINGPLKGEKTKDKAGIKELSCQEKKDSCRVCSAKILVSNSSYKTYDEFKEEYSKLSDFEVCLKLFVEPHEVLIEDNLTYRIRRHPINLEINKKDFTEILTYCIRRHPINLEINKKDFTEIKNLERKANPFSHKYHECLYDLERLDGKIPYSQLMNLHSKCSVITGKYKGIREKIRPIKEKIVAEMIEQLNEKRNILEKEQEMDINFMCPICDDWNCERSSGGW